MYDLSISDIGRVGEDQKEATQDAREIFLLDDDSLFLLFYANKRTKQK
jgi:hypothetical protein